MSLCRLNLNPIPSYRYQSLGNGNTGNGKRKGDGNSDGIDDDGDREGDGEGDGDREGDGDGEGGSDGDGEGGSDGDREGDGDGDGEGGSDSDGEGDSDGDSDDDREGDSDGDGDGNGDLAMDGVESLLMEEDSIPSSMRKPLYPGAAVTVCAAYCAIMIYAISNKLSYTSIESLLKLLRLLCPSSSQLPSSLYKLKKFFQQFTPNYTKQRICPQCERVLRKGEFCPASHGKCGHLIKVPMEKALTTIIRSKLQATTCHCSD